MQILFMRTIAAVLLFLTGLLTSSFSPVNAQSSWVFRPPAVGLDNAKKNDLLNKEGATAYDSAVRLLVKSGEIMCTMNATTQDQTECERQNNEGVMRYPIKFMASMYTTPPASTYAFLYDAGQTLGFIPRQAMAQGAGIGFAGLAPLLPIWKTFRNISYALLAIVMLIIGFMIMMRKKIDAKTVVNVQNALPKIIITLLLITFSYAIVGLLIDLMYFLIMIAIMIFKNSGMLPDYATKELNTFITGSIAQNVNIMPESELIWRIVFGVIPGDYTGVLTTIGGMSVGAIAASLIGLATGSAAIGPVIGIAAGLAYPLVTLLISLFMLFLMIRLFAFFLGAYIKIILGLIFAPFQILGEALPGSNSFIDWFKAMVSNIIVFPVGAVMFLLAQVFMKFSDQSGTLWHPPYSSLGSNSITSIAAIIALGILFSIPAIVNQVQELFKAKPLLNIGGVFGQATGPAIQTGTQIMSMLFYLNQLRGVGKGKDQKPDEKHPGPS